MKVTIKRGSLWYGDKCIGPTSGLYTYPGEAAHLGSTNGVVVCTTPARIDLLFVAGNKVAGCEVKTVEDLVGSHRSRRLHRQLRALRETVDVACIIIRGPDDGLGKRVEEHHPKPSVFWGDWLNWQTQGVYILPVPLEGYMDELLVYRKALATTGLRALAGTDLHEPRERKPGWLLRRIPSIGPDKSARLIAAFGSTWNVLVAARAGAVAPILGASVEAKICQAILE